MRTSLVYLFYFTVVQFHAPDFVPRRFIWQPPYFFRAWSKVWLNLRFAMNNVISFKTIFLRKQKIAHTYLKFSLCASKCIFFFFKFEEKSCILFWHFPRHFCLLRYRLGHTLQGLNINKEDALIRLSDWWHFPKR